MRIFCKALDITQCLQLVTHTSFSLFHISAHTITLSFWLSNQQQLRHKSSRLTVLFILILLRHDLPLHRTGTRRGGNYRRPQGIFSPRGQPQGCAGGVRGRRQLEQVAASRLDDGRRRRFYQNATGGALFRRGTQKMGFLNGPQGETSSRAVVVLQRRHQGRAAIVKVRSNR